MEFRKHLFDLCAHTYTSLEIMGAAPKRQVLCKRWLSSLGSDLLCVCVQVLFIIRKPKTTEHKSN